MRVDYIVALADLILGLSNWRVWGRLGWLEVKRRYRRTVLGPLWLTLSLAITSTAMGVVWARLFHQDISTYLPFVTTGMVCWGFMSAIVNEGCGTYTSAEGLVKQLKFPLSTLNCIVIWRNVIVLLNNMVIVLILILIFPVKVNLNTLLFIPGVFILAFNGLWATMVLGMVSVRFRDVPQVVSSFMQVLLFITPIFWPPEQIGAGSRLVTYNYLYHLTNLIRSPLLGKAPELQSYMITITGGVIAGVITIALYARFRQRISYWL